jgi:hypothetical protein
MSVEVGTRKFTALAAASDAFQFPFKYPSVLMRTTMGWIALQFAAAWSIHSVWGLVLQWDATTNAWFYSLSSTLQSMLVSAGPVLLTVLSSAAMAVTWHRFVILGERPRGWLPLHPLRTVRYLGRWLIVTFAVAAIMLVIVLANFMVPGMPGSPVLSLVPLAIVLGHIFAMVRVGLAFPAAAVDELQWTLVRSWRETRGNTLRLLSGMLLVWLPWTALSVTTSYVGEPAEDAYGLRVVLTVFNYALTTVGVIVSAGYYATAFCFFAAPAARAQNIAAEFS